MIAITHAALAATICVLFKVPEAGIPLMVAGSLLPDLDQPRSIIGKVLFFISAPLNKLVGHRKIVHSALLWLPLAVIGLIYWKPLGWLALGSLSHCFLDCWNTTGVELCSPITEKIFVIGSRKYRIATGTKVEFIVLGIFLLLIWLGLVVGQKGGFSAIVNGIIGNYETARHKYELAGKHVCYVKGKLRLADGSIKKERWLVVGTEGSKALAIYDDDRNKVLHIPGDAEFFRIVLEETPELWESIELEGFFTIEQGSDLGFARMGGRWVKVSNGDVVYGKLIHQGGVKIKTLASEVGG